MDRDEFAKKIDEIPDEQLSPPIVKPERVRELMKELPEEIVSGENPEEFAREMGISFAYGERRLYERDGGLPPEYLVFLRRSDLPEILRRGLGDYEAATLRTQGGPPSVNLHESEALAGIEWSRMFPERASLRENLFGE